MIRSRGPLARTLFGLPDRDRDKSVVPPKRQNRPEIRRRPLRIPLACAGTENNGVTLYDQFAAYDLVRQFTASVCRQDRRSIC